MNSDEFFDTYEEEWELKQAQELPEFQRKKSNINESPDGIIQCLKDSTYFFDINDKSHRNSLVNPSNRNSINQNRIIENKLSTSNNVIQIHELLSKNELSLEDSPQQSNQPQDLQQSTFWESCAQINPSKQDENQSIESIPQEQKGELNIQYFQKQKLIRIPTKDIQYEQNNQKELENQLFYNLEKVHYNNKLQQQFKYICCIQEIYQDKIFENELTKNEINYPIWVLKFSPNGQFLATGGLDGILKIYNIDQNENNIDILEPDCKYMLKHDYDILDLVWNSDNQTILTCSFDKKAILWDIQNNTQQGQKIFQHKDSVTCIQFHPQNKDIFVSGSFDKLIRIWSISKQQVIDYIQMTDYFITCICFSPIKNVFLTGNHVGVIKIFNMENKLKFVTETVCKNRRNFLSEGKGKKVTNIIFIDKSQFLVTTNDSRIRILNINSLNQLFKYKGHSNKNMHIKADYDQNKELIISGSEDGKVYIWNKGQNNVPAINPKFTFFEPQKNCSYEHFQAFAFGSTTCCQFVPTKILELFNLKLKQNKYQIQCDVLFVAANTNSLFKIYASLLEN